MDAFDFMMSMWCTADLSLQVRDFTHVQHPEGAEHTIKPVPVGDFVIRACTRLMQAEDEPVIDALSVRQ